MRHGWDATKPQNADLSRRRLGSAMRTALSIWPGEGYCSLGVEMPEEPGTRSEYRGTPWLQELVGGGRGNERGAWNWRCIIGAESRMQVQCGQGRRGTGSFLSCLPC